MTQPTVMPAIGPLIRLEDLRRKVVVFALTPSPYSSQCQQRLRARDCNAPFSYDSFGLTLLPHPKPESGVRHRRRTSRTILRAC